MSSTAPSSTSSSTLDARLAALEVKIIGSAGGGGGGGTKISDDDVPSRLSKLQSQVEKKLQQHQQQSQSSSSSSSSSQQQVPLRELWLESRQILRELDPGIALTYHTQHQPVLFKRQQVLAAANDLQADMKRLDEISKLLLTGTKQQHQQQQGQGPTTATTKSSKSNGGSAAAAAVSQAPILTSENYASTTVPHTQERLDNLRLTILSLTQRTQLVQQQLQSMMESYHTTIVAVSEKCILAEETIQQRQRQRQKQVSTTTTTSGGQPSSEGSS